MIRATPGGGEIDPIELQMNYPRARSDRPWVMANFVTTIDGAAVVDGGASAINDDDDIEMFAAIRAVPDFIVVGSSTVKAENYQPVRLDERRRQARLDAGLDEVPRLVVVSRSLDLDPEARLFGDRDYPITVMTIDGAPGDRVEALSGVAEIVLVPDTTPEGILHELRMARVVLCEGGPTLWGQFVAARAVDEMALTISPMLVSGLSKRLAVGPEAEPPLEMRLDNVVYGDRSLFLRFLRSAQS